MSPPAVTSFLTTSTARAPRLNSAAALVKSAPPRRMLGMAGKYFSLTSFFWKGEAGSSLPGASERIRTILSLTSMAGQVVVADDLVADAVAGEYHRCADVQRQGGSEDEVDLRGEGARAPGLAGSRLKDDAGRGFQRLLHGEFLQEGALGTGNRARRAGAKEAIMVLGRSPPGFSPQRVNRLWA